MSNNQNIIQNQDSEKNSIPASPQELTEPTYENTTHSEPITTPSEPLESSTTTDTPSLANNDFMDKKTEKEKQIIPQIILNDLKYLSVRQLYFSWFFPTGAEVANQLIDNVIKVYLQSIERQDLIKKIRKWGGNETHNVVRIIKMLIAELSLDFDLKGHGDILESLYKLYQNRYLDSLKKTGACKTLLKDLTTIDYTYKYFRDKVSISDEAREETIINKLFYKNQNLLWGVDNISLYDLFYRNNQSFKN